MNQLSPPCKLSLAIDELFTQSGIVTLTPEYKAYVLTSKAASLFNQLSESNVTNKQWVLDVIHLTQFPLQTRLLKIALDNEMPIDERIDNKVQHHKKLSRIIAKLTKTKVLTKKGGGAHTTYHKSI